MPNYAAHLNFGLLSTVQKHASNMDIRICNTSVRLFQTWRLRRENFGDCDDAVLHPAERLSQMTELLQWGTQLTEIDLHGSYDAVAKMSMMESFIRILQTKFVMNKLFAFVRVGMECELQYSKVRALIEDLSKKFGLYLYPCTHPVLCPHYNLGFIHGDTFVQRLKYTCFQRGIQIRLLQRVFPWVNAFVRKHFGLESFEMQEKLNRMILFHQREPGFHE